MKTPKRTGKKVWWKDFRYTRAYEALQRTARKHGYVLNVIYDDKDVALDVHPIKVDVLPSV